MFEWTDFLEVAEELASRDNEASRRSAISRAYYCAYHRARILIERDNIWLPKDGRSHREVWNVLEHQHEPRRTIGEIGRKLFRARLNADYSSENLATPEETNLAMRFARNIIRQLGREMRAVPSTRYRR